MVPVGAGYGDIGNVGNVTEPSSAKPSSNRSCQGIDERISETDTTLPFRVEMKLAERAFSPFRRWECRIY